MWISLKITLGSCSDDSGDESSNKELLLKFKALGISTLKANWLLRK